MEAECCVQDMLGGWSDTVDTGILQQEAGAFVLGVQSESYCVLDVTKPPSTEVRRTLVAGAALGSEDVCPVSRAGGFAVMQVCSPPDRVGDSEYHQSLPADLC